MSLKVLFIALEFSTWKKAKHWSYGAQLGFEEGFRENNVEFFTVTTQLIPQIKEICSGMHFDQVWVEIVHNNIDKSTWEWLVDKIPIRIGIICESLDYSEDECINFPILKERRALVENKFKYLTHIIASDEVDSELINNNHIPCFWLAHTVPKNSILHNSYDVHPPNKFGSFTGSVYGRRANWLAYQELNGLLIRQPSPENGTVYPYQFDILQFISRIIVKSRFPYINYFHPKYIDYLRQIRITTYNIWLKSLQSNVAVVNLPSLVKAYPGRVIEGMAAGRPVISCEVQNRPKNRALFEDGVEILLYSNDNPHQLAEHIKRIIAEPCYAYRISSNARRKIERYHTVEKRVQEILNWLENGDIQNYG